MALTFKNPPQLTIAKEDLLMMVSKALDCDSVYSAFGGVVPTHVDADVDGTFTIYFAAKPSAEAA